MLLSFRCENSYSFAHNACISMLASNENDERFVIKRGNRHILPVVSIYGANASGKSNYIKALSNMFMNICGDEAKLRGEAFAFDGNLNEKPVICEMVFCLPNESDLGEGEYTEYIYGYELSCNRINNYENPHDGEIETIILKEWLLSRKMGSDVEFSNVFIREGHTVNFGEEAYNAVEPLKKTIEKSRNTLFLKLAGRTDEEPFSTIYDWCSSSTQPEWLSDENMKKQIARVAGLVCRSRAYRENFKEFLQEFDPCIKNIVGRENNATDGGYELLVIHENNNPKKDSDNEREISIFEESDGTQKIASMYHMLMTVLKYGGLILVDELDTKLHPAILRGIIKSFHGETNKLAQLVFTAHNLVALDSSDVRGDEVYFIEKNESGYSQIGKLPNEIINSQMDRKFGKFYLAGRFGATKKHFNVKVNK
ncbi:MAG: ATP-binding protein [Defluviitaleaceae bacterium]|nr:ATP-binding protein [Defluviitaleaceae bacterium]